VLVYAFPLREAFIERAIHEIRKRLEWCHLEKTKADHGCARKVLDLELGQTVFSRQTFSYLVHRLFHRAHWQQLLGDKSIYTLNLGSTYLPIQISGQICWNVRNSNPKPPLCCYWWDFIPRRKHASVLWGYRVSGGRLTKEVLKGLITAKGACLQIITDFLLKNAVVSRM